jgi:hypothetical protein
MGSKVFWPLWWTEVDSGANHTFYLIDRMLGPQKEAMCQIDRRGNRYSWEQHMVMGGGI